MHDGFVTTRRGLDRSLPPMRLFEKAKRFGVWNPSLLDFAPDRAHWLALSDIERDVILRLTALFVAGEEAVTLDLLPLIRTVAREGRLEEEMFLTTFLWEEAKHTDFFERFVREVTDHGGRDLSHYHTDTYRALFYQALPTALNRLDIDTSPEAQVVASVTYNMVVEGVLAETGYHAFFTMLQRNNIFPATVEGVQKLKQDESRHIAYGVYLISRLVAEHPNVWDAAEDAMNTLFPLALGVINEIFMPYDPAPFGLEIDDFIGFAASQFQKRFARIAAARGGTLEAVTQATDAAIDAEDS
ncbi:MAG: R2-like ligand-binding oxidase [Anaerolineae bacterium]|jgi:ribonucleoside-diphosphate reductase beta chain|nr:R2-like ligand-binding oxidase [Anaerolineae bacterium]